MIICHAGSDNHKRKYLKANDPRSCRNEAAPRRLLLPPMTTVVDNNGHSSNIARVAEPQPVFESDKKFVDMDASITIRQSNNFDFLDDTIKGLQTARVNLTESPATDLARPDKIQIQNANCAIQVRHRAPQNSHIEQKQFGRIPTLTMINP